MNGMNQVDVERRWRDWIELGLFLGLACGLLEGVTHVALQQLVLENSWYQIVWIAPVFNGLLLAVLGGLCALILAVMPDRRLFRTMAAFGLAAAALLPWISLLLKEWIEPYAVFLLLLGAAATFARWYQRDPAAVHRRSSRALTWVAVLTALAGLGIEGSFWIGERVRTSRLPAASETAPDIVVVIVDALRADHLSGYGYDRSTSPTLDRMAAQGVLFEQASSTSSYTLPSHASILTGLYPFQHGVEWQTSKRRVSDMLPNLPETLQTLGYRTGAFSANTFWFSREHGFGRGFLHFDDYFHSIADRVLRTAYGRIAAHLIFPRLGWEDVPARRRAPEINEAVLSWTGRGPDRPFFVILNYFDAHDPYLPPQPHRNQFATRPNPGGLLHWQLHVPETLSPADLQSEIDAYDGSIAYVDAQIARLLSALQTRSSRRELLVVVTSDHGDEFNEHGGFLHGLHLYREVTHVPLIMWQPGQIPAGIRVRTPVTNASIPATILEHLGARAQASAAPALQPLWRDEAAAPAWPAPLAEISHRPWVERGPVRDGSLRALVAGTLHYIEHDARPPELYDWAADPRESLNLAARPDLGGLLERFRLSLAAARGKSLAAASSD